MTIINFKRPEIDFTGMDIHFFTAMRNQPIGYQVVVPADGEIKWDVAPFGSVTIDGDVEAALPHLLAWIDPAAICHQDLTWRQAIADNLRAGLTVDLDTLPVGVLRRQTGEAVGKTAGTSAYSKANTTDDTTDETADLPRGWTHASMVEAAAYARLSSRTRGRIDRW